ncbi:MAG: hydroxyacid dehydrogenase [Acidimicrobiaceae bacterium]|nr:hydroxyacid dehydrogenase [Acidimicrobiaceae bacterium]
MTRNVAVAPETRPEMHQRLCAAVEAAGAQRVDMAEAEGLIWADPANTGAFPELVADADRLEWIQLPYAGIEPFAHHLDDRWTWTCGKGVYAPAVAETALAMALAGFKHLHGYAREQTWSAHVGRLLAGSRVTVLGGGGIAECLLPLLKPFGCHTTVVRRSGHPLDGADRTLNVGHLSEVLPSSDLLILALALTDETRGIIDATAIDLLPDDAWIVNVARGGHIVTDDLVAALGECRLGGAALDVTDPEPLPDGHPLWTLPNCLITPHIGNTPEMGLDLLEPFVEENVRRFCEGRDLLAPVDVALGY